ncbi:MAG: sigma factor-like helix-turn-helix DNA-binding protein [Candidatus Kerfeldbacteria bacterium]
MTDSILDKVLSSKEDQEKQDFNPLEVVNTLLKSLGSKEADVVRRRYGLTDQGKETLETIGSFYNVTRERIRQIENQSIAKIKSGSAFSEIMRPVEHLVSTLVDKHGGLITEQMLYETLLGVHKDSEQYKLAVSFIITQLLDEKLEEIPKTKKYHPGWKLRLTSMDFIDQGIQELEKLVEQIGKPATFDELYEKLQETEFYKNHDQKLTEDSVASYLEVSTRLARNPFDEYGLADWGLIQPKRMNDRVFLVLQKEGQPMHFEEIAKRITKIFKKAAYPPTVHNELILNDEYVLVGRGIYALKEWGFKEGVVASVIQDILKQAGQPMKRSDIVDMVLKQRIVKKNTIHLALTDKSLFNKTKDGRYALAEDSGESHQPEEKIQTEAADEASS